MHLVGQIKTQHWLYHQTQIQLMPWVRFQPAIVLQIFQVSYAYRAKYKTNHQGHTSWGFFSSQNILTFSYSIFQDICFLSNPGAFNSTFQSYMIRIIQIDFIFITKYYFFIFKFPGHVIFCPIHAFLTVPFSHTWSESPRFILFQSQYIITLSYLSFQELYIFVQSMRF